MDSTETNYQTQFRQSGYVLQDDLALTLSLMSHLQRPLLLEGEAGVGKTELARVLAATKNTELIRLQCYEGLDANAAVYEWNYAKQLLAIKQNETKSSGHLLDIFTSDFLLERPLLKSIQQSVSPVLLIDEVDRADEAFEAFLLELLSDFEITVPELGTVTATSIPAVILTSNGTRELSDALRRRCLYFYLDYPDAKTERHILNSRVPGIADELTAQVVGFIQTLRSSDLKKPPGIAESIDWATALTGMSVKSIVDSPDMAYQSRSCYLKNQEDMETINQNKVNDILSCLG